MASFKASSANKNCDDQDEDEDFLIALQLQSQFDQDEKKDDNQPKEISQIHPMHVVDRRWELIDPNPNIYTLFQQFNQQFFYGKLDSVYVEWSKRMTRCAGICYYRRGGECRIALSESYLTLRPRKDLVETLLHEMIHAYLFVTHNNRDRDGHGPEFHKHMIRINDATGTNITVYHTFMDEYKHLHNHWWRCTGVCREWKPFFGYVKRSMNRAPSSNDRWWDEHERRCGGKFEKVKEPEGYKSKASQKRSTSEMTLNEENDRNSHPTSSKPSSPAKKKTKIARVIPGTRTLETFFQKTKSQSSLSNVKSTETAVVHKTHTRASTGNDDADNAKKCVQECDCVKCPKCETLLPKGNLFIHQIRCYK